MRAVNLLGVLGLLALALAAGAHAENMPQGSEASPSAARLKEIESQLKQSQAERDKAAAAAATQAREAETLRTDMITTATTIQENEEALSDLETQLKSLDAEERVKTAALDLRRQQMNGVITALARMAFRPTEAVIGQPTSPADTVRSAILLREEVPRLRQAAAALRADLDAVAKVRAAIAGQKQKIAATSAKLDADHRHLAALYAKKTEARDLAMAQSHETEARLAALAVQAQDVRDLLARIDNDRAEREKAEAERERAAREKAVRELAETGARNKDQPSRDQSVVALNAPPPPTKPAEREVRAAPAPAPAAPVIAAPKPEAPRAAPEAPPKPEAATARSGPMRSFAQAQGHMPFPARGSVAIHFGQVNEAGLPAKGITVATRQGAQVVAPYDGEVAFAGPFRGYGLLLIIEHSEGYHTLLAGMARIDSAVGQRLLAGEPVGVMDASEEKPLLYFELRHQGQPINPLPWLMAHKSKVSE